MQAAWPPSVFPPSAAPGYGAAPPASRVATAIATRRAYGPPLTPEPLRPLRHTAARAGAAALPAGPRGAQQHLSRSNPYKQVSTVPGYEDGWVGCWRGDAVAFRFQSPPVEPCVRFSRTRLTDALHRRCSISPARPGGAWVRRR